MQNFSRLPARYVVPRYVSTNFIIFLLFLHGPDSGLEKDGL